MQGILFDLDGTLLDIDMQVFLPRYFKALAPVVAEVIETSDHRSAIDAVMSATNAMMLPHGQLTNREAFNREFERLTGTDLAQADGVLEVFYAETFPTLGDDTGPREGAREAVQAAFDLGLKVAVATNPIFPASAIAERIRWAGLGDVPFHAVTTYERMHACKPRPEYFSETAGLLGLAPGDCLMVGDDAELDMPAEHTGMSTFYVGHAGTHGHTRGSLTDLAAAIPLRPG